MNDEKFVTYFKDKTVADTFTDLKRIAKDDFVTGSYESTPNGHFEMTAVVLGITTVYLLRGELEQADAPIVGRIELGTMSKIVANAYKSDRIKGGTLVSMDQDGIAATLIKISEM